MSSIELPKIKVIIKEIPTQPKIETIENVEPLKNRGTGAGGENTNKLGKKFEELTDNETNLISLGFKKINMNKSKAGYYLIGQLGENTEVVFMKQNGFKLYMKKTFGIDCIRNPDEAYIIKKGDSYCVKIIEKKEQNVAGSVETKLWSGPSLKREFEIVLGQTFKVCYAFTLNSFFNTKFSSNEKKYNVLKQILDESHIQMFFGDESNYYEQLTSWINQ